MKSDIEQFMDAENDKIYIKNKIPLDLRIIVYFLYTTGFYMLVLSFLLFTPFARIGESERYIFFETFSLFLKIN
jgi:hypothetical protein